MQPGSDRDLVAGRHHTHGCAGRIHHDDLDAVQVISRQPVQPAGVIRSIADCTPIADTRIEFWLAGPDGTFDADHRATVIADASGTYRFESNFPPAYDGNPPHIFVRVTAPAHQPLVTRHYPIINQSEGTLDLIVIPAQ
jgi:hypothetical protein